MAEWKNLLNRGDHYDPDCFVLYLAFMVACDVYLCALRTQKHLLQTRFWTEKVTGICSFMHLRRVLGDKNLSYLEFFADRILSLLLL
jgi:hypothetical protein